MFSWDDIPGNDNVRLIECLKTRFGTLFLRNIDWVETANIEKTNDGRTIRLSFKNNFLNLKLNDEKTEVSLIIDDGRSDVFIARTENGKLNIYNLFIFHFIPLWSEIRASLATCLNIAMKGLLLELWTRRDSNPRPLRCERNDLPLIYRPC